ncbi:acyl-CoA thioesterase [Chryseobacterium sp. POL2]|uniref:acyl-CoA thioesterase n=1 Tax=Chryseobacterium sp. POL2 TaxID=2713414 RepID=UPI0013E1B71B|nr:acyl-CoA thioesterase [Chryseobacterium sp. POL2]QIG90306.1 acyl-CoA thioesterase [Chryseobacterium sp. POL2]
MEKEFKSIAKIRFGDCDPIGHLNNINYLVYMLNAREDHVEQHFGFTYEEYATKTGFTWVSIQNEIAYFKEVRYNKKVVISSKLIDLQDRISKVEILMMSEDEKTIHAVLWMTVIHFSMKSRKSVAHPPETLALFEPTIINLEEKDFTDRTKVLRQRNKK